MRHTVEICDEARYEDLLLHYVGGAQLTAVNVDQLGNFLMGFGVLSLGYLLNADLSRATAVLGVGNNVDSADSKKSIGRIVGDVGTTMARRVFIDPAVLILALFGLAWLSFAGLTAGAVVGLAVIFPTHIRLVQSRRAARAAE